MAFRYLPCLHGAQRCFVFAAIQEIGVSQKAAWFMLQRIRKACWGNSQNDGNSFLRLP
jgi:hypothetical protein